MEARLASTGTSGDMPGGARRVVRLAANVPTFPEDAFIGYFQDGYLNRPFKQAVIGTDESLTYAEAFLRAKTFLRCLVEDYRIGPGSVVALASENVVDMPVIMAAVQACGAMLVLCSPRAELRDYLAYARLVRPDLYIVFRPDACDALSREFPDLPIMTLRCKREGYPSVERTIAVNREASMAYMPALEDDRRFEKARIVLFSSGSTGKPKAIVNRFSSFHHNAREIVRAFGITREDVLYLPVPFFHSYGMIGLYAALSEGSTVATLQKYRPESSLTTIESARVSVYFGVPTMYLREMRVNEDDEWNLSSLRVAKIAGAPCPEAAAVEYERRYGCAMISSYGMTETAATVTTANFESSLRVRTAGVGKPIDGVQVKLDPETGEVLVKSVSMMDGILLEDGTLDPGLDDDGWFHTGDVAAVDDEGNYFITGRIKDIVIRGGVNIFPAEIENFYQEHGDIAESCLVGYPDPELGERTCLCVVEKEGANNAAAALRGYAMGRLEKCKIPDVVLKMDELPRLANGKTDKNALRDAVAKTLAGSGHNRPWES